MFWLFSLTVVETTWSFETYSSVSIKILLLLIKFTL